jgi:hypothetical protein
MIVTPDRLGKLRSFAATLDGTGRAGAGTITVKDHPGAGGMSETQTTTRPAWRRERV